MNLQPFMAVVNHNGKGMNQFQYNLPFLGVGIGLRREHFDSIFESKRQIDWVEIISENFMDFGGKPRIVLERAAERWPVVCHGVNLSLGSIDPISLDYLHLLKKLVRSYKMPWFSDHLAFSSVQGNCFHDLLPLPRTEETIEHVVSRIRSIQNFLERSLLLENISYYSESKLSVISEAEFILKILRQSDALLLLDINNVYVNSQNHGFDPRSFLMEIPPEKVAEIHLAGHKITPELIIDTHGERVSEKVWDLYRYFIKLAGRPITTLIEWDNNIPELDTLLDQADLARHVMTEALEK